MALAVAFYACVILLALVVFFLKVTYGGNDFIELVFKALGKFIPLFVLAYATLKLADLYGYIKFLG